LLVAFFEATKIPIRGIVILEILVKEQKRWVKEDMNWPIMPQLK